MPFRKKSKSVSVDSTAELRRQASQADITARPTSLALNKNGTVPQQNGTATPASPTDDVMSVQLGADQQVSMHRSSKRKPRYERGEGSWPGVRQYWWLAVVTSWRRCSACSRYDAVGLPSNVCTYSALGDNFNNVVCHLQ